MEDDLFTCMASCHRTSSSSSALVGHNSYDLECITQCSQRQTTLYHKTAEKYTYILQIIAIVLITFGLFGKFLNGIIFLRKPFRGTPTGLLLLLKTIFDTILLLWLFIFDAKFFITDEQMNTSGLLCLLTRTTDIILSWSIGFIILVCIIRFVKIIHPKYLPQLKHLHVFLLILLMIICGLAYNWHVFYYPKLVRTILDENKNDSITYCNILFGRYMGYFSYSGFQTTQQFFHNIPINNFIVSSLIPLIIVASINILIIFYISKSSPEDISRINLDKKDMNYETIIILITTFIFLITNGIGSIYIYIKTNNRSYHRRSIEDLKTLYIYLIIRMLALIGIILEFYIYFFIEKKFRDEVYYIIEDIIHHTPLKYCFKNKNIPTKLTKTDESCIDSQQRQKMLNIQSHDNKKTIEKTESTV